LISAISTIFQGVVVYPWAWMGLRFVSGAALSGVFIAIESWFVKAVPSDQKSHSLVLYTFLYYIAVSLGQLLLILKQPAGWNLFVTVSVLFVLSLLPMVGRRMLHQKMRQLDIMAIYRVFLVEPWGSVLMFFSGVYLGVIYSFYPYYLALRGMRESQIAWVMMLTLAGAGLFQLILAKIIKRYRTTTILVIACGVILILIGLLSVCSVRQVYVLSFLLGGVVCFFYPVGLSVLTARCVTEDVVVRVSVGTVFYGLGASIGPFMLGPLMGYCGHVGLLIFLALSSVVVIFSTLFQYDSKQSSGC